MKRKGKAGIILITAGSLLLAAALFLVGHNMVDEYRAGKTANHILEVLHQQIPTQEERKTQEDTNALHPAVTALLGGKFLLQSGLAVIQQ